MTALQNLLSNFPESIQARFWEARDWILRSEPSLQEEVDPSAKVVGYGLGKGYKGMVCTLILSQNGLQLGLAYAAEFADAKNLLAGKGKVHRHVVLPSSRLSEIDGLAALLELAIAACKMRLGK